MGPEFCQIAPPAQTPKKAWREMRSACLLRGLRALIPTLFVACQAAFFTLRLSLVDVVGMMLGQNAAAADKT